jgi:uncharacterized repeat protein (TIGR01451 family)
VKTLRLTQLVLGAVLASAMPWLAPAVAAAASDVPASCLQSSVDVTCTYTSGDNVFLVPAGVVSIHVQAVGGHGAAAANQAGGFGAIVTGDLDVVPGTALHAVVGGNASRTVGGANGGGTGAYGGTCSSGGSGGGGGGGASDLRMTTNADSRLLVAAGGGGAGCPEYLSGSPGGNAGASADWVFDTDNGGPGQVGCTSPGDPVNCSTGGAAGTGPLYNGNPGMDASGSTGGAGGSGSNPGGGGGGGYYGGGGGGGGGAEGVNVPGNGGGGGGGSNLVPTGGTVALDKTGIGPKVQISYALAAPISFNVATAGSSGSTGMTITFDAAPDAVEAVTLANYDVPGLTLSGTPVLSANTVTIATSTQAAQRYTVTVSNVTSASDATPLTTNTASFTGTAPPPRPSAGVSPASIRFGNVRVGTPSTSQLVTVSAAPGTSELHVGQLAMIGANGIDFGVGADQCSNTTLAAGMSCTALVTFIPQSRGSRTATLQVPDDAADSPQTVSLSGTGVAPVALVTPSSLDFGTVEVGTPSPHRTITVTNTGDAGQDLMITAESLTPANSGFAIVTDHCASIGAVAPNTSCTIELTFTPPAAGARSATLSLTDNAAGSPHTVALTGTGGVPSADLAVSISASPNPVKTGQKVTYTITVLNAGPSTASSILINDSLSSQSTFVSATIIGGTCVTPKLGSSGVVSCSLSSLASGATKPVQIVVTVIAKKTSITNTVTVSAATADPNLANNTASITTRLK